MQCRRADLRGLQQICVGRLNVIHERLDLLLKSVPLLWESDATSIVHDYRALTEQLGLIERSGVFALIHSANNDPFLSRLVQRICEDIGYPVQVPIVSETSPSHFAIDQEFRVLYVPPLESRFLLHLPDLYHELGHPILLDVNLNLPRLKPVKTGYTLAIFDRIQSLRESIVENERLQGAEIERRRMISYCDFWTNSWMREFYCDLFATYCLGPAFAWSHCHLCLRLPTDPFETPRLGRSTHPSDASRMSVILNGLEALGFKLEVKKIGRAWADQMRLGGSSANMSHKQCYPDNVLREIAEGAVRAFREVGLKAARPGGFSGVALCLNQAWDQFWLNSQGFGDWEASAIEHLRKELAGGAP